MPRFRLTALILAIAALAAAPVAHAEKRIALLIGNKDYPAEIGTLANPHNDIALLEKALKGLQFEVTSVRDAGLATLHQVVNAYARRVKAAGPNAVAFFYYAGHGAADAGTNYLIPVDVKSADEDDLWDQSLRLTEITRKLKVEAGNAIHFVVFDACRNNLKLRKAGSRTLFQSRGFVPVAQESGMLIAYATAEGELASDVGVGAGPYSSVLAEEIVKPDIEAVTMFRNVQLRVRAAIGQEPWIGFSALGSVHLAGTARSDPPKVALAPPPGPPVANPLPPPKWNYGPPAPPETAKTRVTGFIYHTSPQEIDPGPRIFRREADDTWSNTYPSGHVDGRMRIRTRIVVSSCNGSVVGHDHEPEFALFIPDKGCPGMMLRWRRGESSWNLLDRMQNVR